MGYYHTIVKEKRVVVRTRTRDKWYDSIGIDWCQTHLLLTHHIARKFRRMALCGQSVPVTDYQSIGGTYCHPPKVKTCLAPLYKLEDPARFEAAIAI